jgi:hypothetical protein
MAQIRTLEDAMDVVAERLRDAPFDARRLAGLKSVKDNIDAAYAALPE